MLLVSPRTARISRIKRMEPKIRNYLVVFKRKTSVKQTARNDDSPIKEEQRTFKPRKVHPWRHRKSKVVATFYGECLFLHTVCFRVSHPQCRYSPLRSCEPPSQKVNRAESSRCATFIDILSVYFSVMVGYDFVVHVNYLVNQWTQRVTRCTDGDFSVETLLFGWKQ